VKTDKEPIVMSELNEKTKVPLGIAATFMVVVVGCTFWVNTTISTLQSQLKDLAFEIKFLSARLDVMTTDRIGRGDMDRWIDMLRATNPSLNIPVIGNK
jgi:hypothetical protein